MKLILKKLSVLPVFACIFLAGIAATAQDAPVDNALAPKKEAVASGTSGEGPWLARVRFLGMSNSNRSARFSAAGVNFAPDSILVSDKVFPEVDMTYFITRHWAAELVATYPQDHGVTVKGLGQIGTIRHLPPVLTVQYHQQLKNSRVTPYVGLGHQLQVKGLIDLSSPSQDFFSALS